MLAPSIAAVLAACAASGPDNLHGPAFGADSGAAEDGAGGPGGDDASADGPSDAATGDATGGQDDGPGEASTDGPADTGHGDGGGCTSTMALLSTSSSSMAEAVFAHGKWSTASVVSGGASTTPSLIALGSGYMATFVGTGSAGTLPLKWTAYTGSWSAPAAMGAALAQGTPALAAIGTSAHVVYWGSDGKFYHGTYAGSWDTASDRVQSSGGAQSFGPSAPAVAATGATLVVAQSGQDGQIYEQPWTGSWQAAAAVAGSSAESLLSPAIVATSGASDAMIVFVHAGDAGDYHLQYAVRTAGVWSVPAELYDQSGNIAYAGTTPSLAALPGGGAVVAWMGSSPAHAYVSTYDPQNKWTAPAAVGSAVLASPPSVAAGVCGAGAALAFVQTTGEVDVATQTGGTWGTPVAIAGANGMQNIALATSP